MAEIRAKTMVKEDVVRETAEALRLRTKKLQLRISWEEFNERWFKGLCMFCDELETPDHHLCHKNSGILMVDCEEDKTRNDEELVVNEVVTESDGIKQQTVNNEENANENLDILKEESITQIQVPVSSLESSLQIHNASSTVCENSQDVVGLFGHEEAMLQVSDVQARAVVLKKSEGVTNNQVAHQLFDKMPSKEKRIKHLKGWRFKFKRKNLTGIMLQIEQYKLMERRRRRYKKFSTNIKDESMRVLITGNHRRMVRQLHISRVQCKIRMMNDSWNMRRLTLKVMKSHRKHKWKSKKLQTASNFWINHPQELVELVLRTALTEHSLPLVDSRTKNLAPFVMQYVEVQEMVSMQDNETSLLHHNNSLLKHQVSISHWEFSHRSSIECLDVYDDWPSTIVRTHQSQSNFDLEYAAISAYQVCDSMSLGTKLLTNGRRKTFLKTWRFKFKNRWTQEEPAVIRFLIRRHLYLNFDCEAPELAGRKRNHGLLFRLRSKQKQRKCPKCWMFKFRKRRLTNGLENKKTWRKWRVRKHDNLSWKEDASDKCRSISSRCIVEVDIKEDDQKQQGDLGHSSLIIAVANRSHLWSTSYHVWHRWKARVFVEMISTMRAWLFGEEGFDIGNEVWGSNELDDTWMAQIKRKSMAEISWLKTVVKKR